MAVRSLQHSLCTTSRTRCCTAARSSEGAVLFHVYDELHLRMNGATHVEITRLRKGDVGFASGLLVARIKGEFLRVDICVMQEIPVVIDDLNRLTARDRNFARIEFAPLLRNYDLRSRHGDSRRHRACREGERALRGK